MVSKESADNIIASRPILNHEEDQNLVIGQSNWKIMKVEMTFSIAHPLLKKPFVIRSEFYVLQIRLERVFII